MMKIMTEIIEKIKYLYIIMMNLMEIKEYFQEDLPKYNSYDAKI